MFYAVRVLTYLMSETIPSYKKSMKVPKGYRGGSRISS
jgi:hypothetical protein